MLQLVGTRARQANPDIWVSRLVQHITDAPTVISDVRYPNEVQYLRKCFPSRVHVVRIHSETPIDNHESKLACDDIQADYHLYNDCDSLDSWEGQVRLFAHRMFYRSRP